MQLQAGSTAGSPRSPCFSLKALLTLSLANQASAIFPQLFNLRSYDVYSFGARAAGDVELFKQVVKRSQLFIQDRVDTVRYPPLGASTRNIVTRVEVEVPRRLVLQDEVRIIGGGPGLNYVALTVGGSMAPVVDFTVTVFGRDLDQDQDSYQRQREAKATPNRDEGSPSGQEDDEDE